MNRHRKRLTLGVVVVGLAVVLGLVLAIAQWGSVRDHVEAWYFQLTRETETIAPEPGSREHLALRAKVAVIFELKGYLRMLSALSGVCVIMEVTQDEVFVGTREGRTPLWDQSATMRDSVCDVLRTVGWRLIEQRFPQRAYLVIRDNP